MIFRRTLLRAATAASVTSLTAARAQLINEDFDTLFESLLADPRKLVGGNSREGRADHFDTKAIAPRLSPSRTEISERATQLIILFEVTSASVYEKKYQTPVLPAAESGITIGVGYDLGYVKAEWMLEDWTGLLSAESLKRLEKICGLKGSSAKEALSTLKGISVPWVIAEEQFRKRLLPRYVAETERALPNTAVLSKDSLGALVSLVYNRGASFRRAQPRYKEMRNILAHMENSRFSEIPQEFLDMRRIWQGQQGTQGLLQRRILEASLFQRGLTPQTK